MGKFNVSTKNHERNFRSTGQVNNGPDLTEPGESLPMKMQIERMMDAGVQQHVAAAMAKLYHFGPDGTIPDAFIDPTQDFGFNVYNAKLLREYLEAKVRGEKERAEEIKKEAERKAKEKAAAQAESGAK